MVAVTKEELFLCMAEQFTLFPAPPFNLLMGVDILDVYTAREMAETIHKILEEENEM